MKKFILKNLFSIFGEKKKEQLRIITFHDILREDHDKFLNLIQYLKKNWNIITPDQSKNIINSKDLKDLKVNKKNILITFDDAFKSQKIITEKFLDPLNIKALFFIVSDFVKISSKDEAHKFIKKNFFKDQNLDHNIDLEANNMSLDDLRYLVSKGHTIGGHTKTHKQLSKIKDKDTLIKEIIDSKKFLENEIGIKIEDFAYTFGDLDSINKVSVDIIMKNFNYLYSGLRGNNSNISSKILRRDAVDMKEDFEVISAYLNGYVDLIYNKKLIKLEKWNC
jgi:peptidoglycan/xylan/chitin deacetylase (PgdA/CDA1 family)|tara:strand:+ start:35602 stop:36438 length:837 start_codon:yes stop_codon:yes gene_type:complete